jgi:hypothetical protein
VGLSFDRGTVRREDARHAAAFDVIRDVHMKSISRNKEMGCFVEKGFTAASQLLTTDISVRGHCSDSASVCD